MKEEWLITRIIALSQMNDKRLYGNTLDNNSNNYGHNERLQMQSLNRKYLILCLIIYLKIFGMRRCFLNINQLDIWEKKEIFYEITFLTTKSIIGLKKEFEY